MCMLNIGYICQRLKLFTLPVCLPPGHSAKLLFPATLAVRCGDRIWARLKELLPDLYH